jgi:hypothetical protein
LLPSTVREKDAEEAEKLLNRLPEAEQAIEGAEDF